MPENQNLIAYCGLYCGACSFRVAAQENDRQHLRAMPAKYAQYRDAPMDICPGCRHEGESAKCAIRNCAGKRGFQHCGTCPDFPCARIREFSDDGTPHHAASIMNLKRLKEIGEEAWLEEQKRRWTCTCGARLSWYQQQCTKCDSAGRDPTASSGRPQGSD